MSKTEKRERVYKYAYDRLMAGNPPTIREVQEAMGFKAVETARSYLEELVEEGRLIKRDTHSRSYGLPPDMWAKHTLYGVPILGSVQAGSLTLALQEPEGFLQTERSRHGENLFALRVRGESMKNAGILPGDLVITKRQDTAEAGDIVVALVEDEATVKRLRFKSRGKKVLLCPENEEFEPLEFTPMQVRILGKVVEVRRFYEGAP